MIVVIVKTLITLTLLAAFLGAVALGILLWWMVVDEWRNRHG